MKSFIDHLTEDNEHYAAAEESKLQAGIAKRVNRPFDHHMHMADHHDHMSQWHSSKGRHGEADKHAQKSDEHHEKAMTVKEEVELDEAVGHTIEAHGIKGAKGTPWRKTFKSHDHLHDWAEKNDSVEVHATRDLESAKKKTNEVKESVDDNRTGFTKKKREDDEYHNEPKPKFKAKSLMDRPHSVHVDGKKWKSFSNGHLANAAAKTLQAKGKKATAIAHFKEHLDEADDAASKREKAMAEFDKQSRAAYWKKHAELKKNAKPVKEEALDEIKMTAAMKLQQAFQREQEKTARERKAGEDLLKKNEPKKTNEEVESVEEGLKPEHNMRPGWMLKADPELAKKIADKKRKFKTFKDTVGKKKD